MGGGNVDDKFTAIYSQYRNQLYSYLHHLTTDPYLAEELVQETFIRAYRFFSKFRGDSSVKTWLYKIALNTYRSHFRKRQTPPTEVPELVADPRDYASSSDTKMTIMEVFDLLSITDRTLLTLRDVDDCSYAEIANVTGMSEDQVRVGLHRARKRFRLLYTEMSKD